jgi:uncharacterized OB-fold protein
VNKDTFDKQRWLENNSVRYGIPIQRLTEAFKDELTGNKDIDSPLEVPDMIKIYYKYSYGEQSRFFRELRDNRRIMGAQCPECKMVYCPPRSNCSRCYCRTNWVPLSGRATIVTCTAIHFTPPTGFKRKLPYVIAYVKLEGSEFLLLAIIDMDDVSLARPGMKVQVEFVEEREGRITDFIFRPVNF